MSQKPPIYQQIEEYIRTQIEDGIYPVGSQIPREFELCDMFNASRMTVNKALVNLVNQGMIYRNAGRGTFVRMRYPESKTHKLFSFSENMSKMGKTVTNKILEYRLIRGEENKEIKEKLNLKDEDFVHKIVRQRFANDELIAVEIMYFSANIVSVIDIKMISSSIHDYIEKHLNLPIHYSEVVLKAVMSDDKTDELFGTKIIEPLLMAMTTSFLQNSTPLEYAVVYYLGNHYEYLTTNHRNR